MSTTIPDSKYDAVIVGARCAGAATAMLLARQGLNVLAVDRGRYGGETLSTHALMRGAVLLLHRWGVLAAIKAAGTTPVTRTTFYYDDEELAIAIKPRYGVDALYAPQRALLDRLLVDAASAAGAHVVHEVGLQGLVRSERGRVTGAVLRDRTGAVHRVEADIVIGADGIRSTVARLAEARTYRMGRHASAVVYGHWAGLCLDGYQWHYRPGVSVGAIPTNNGETCVFVAVPAARFLDLFRGDVGGGHARLLRGAAPELGALVERSEQTGNFHGFAGQTGFFRQSWGPGWALVGDAGYFKDPLTAHGITDALRDAARLSTAVVDGSEGALAEYQSGRDILATDLFDVTDAIASFAWNLAEVRLLHEKLAAAMAREVTSIATDEHQPASREAPPPSSARGRTGPDSPAQAVHPE